jgi:hypothetical protein
VESASTRKVKTQKLAQIARLRVDESTLEIVSAIATTNNVSDGETFPDLLKNAPDAVSQSQAFGSNA